MISPTTGFGKALNIIPVIFSGANTVTGILLLISPFSDGTPSIVTSKLPLTVDVSSSGKPSSGNLSSLNVMSMPSTSLIPSICFATSIIFSSISLGDFLYFAGKSFISISSASSSAFTAASSVAFSSSSNPSTTVALTSPNFVLSI